MDNKSNKHFIQDSSENIRPLNEQTETVHSSPTMSLNDFFFKAAPKPVDTTPVSTSNSTDHTP